MKEVKSLIIDSIKDKSDLEDQLKIAGKMLADGKTVVFPTETVYGLGANALDEEASLKIYKAKGRPSDNPLIVHIAKMEDVDLLAKDVSNDALKLMDAFWPGPLTLILKKSINVPDKTTGGLDTVAIRMPSNKLALRLILNAGVPIAAPSANISGRPSITSPKYLIEELSGKVDAIIIADDSDIGLESTVIDMTVDIPIILRPGKIGKKDIEAVLSKSIRLDSSLMDDKESPKSPGMKYKHYSPKASVVVVSGTYDEMKQKIESKLANDKSDPMKVKVACLNDRTHIYKEFAISLGANNLEAAKNIFSILRVIDDKNIELVYFEALRGDEISEAVMNRLIKAAGNKII